MVIHYFLDFHGLISTLKFVALEGRVDYYLLKGMFERESVN